MYVSKEVDYALKALSVLASHGQQTLTADEISQQFNIPHNFLALLLPKLVRYHLLRAQKQEKSPKPRYGLNRNPAEISVWDIVLAVGGEVELITQSQTDKTHAKTFSAANQVWDELKAVIETHLRQKTLADCSLANS